MSRRTQNARQHILDRLRNPVPVTAPRRDPAAMPEFSHRPEAHHSDQPPEADQAPPAEHASPAEQVPPDEQVPPAEQVRSQTEATRPASISTATLVDAVAAITARQWGLITRAQFLGTGGTVQQLEHWQLTHRLRRVLPEVFLLAGVPASWECRQLAHCLASGGAASHRAAAHLLGNDDLLNPPRELSIARGRHYRPEGVIVHASQDLDRDTLVARRGIPCTSPERTLLDLGQVWTPEQVEVAADDFLRRKVVTWESIGSCWAGHARRGRPGIVTLGQLIIARTGEIDQPDSKPERQIMRLLDTAGIPDGVLHLRVYEPDGMFILESDLGWPEEKVILFYDSFAYHFNHQSFEADPEKRRRASVLGWTILPYTKSTLYGSPWVIAREVRAALGR